MKLLLASGNAKKRAEIEALLTPLDIEVLAANARSPLPEVIEDQPTFAGNAAKKAQSAALFARSWALADDSGLEVDCLGGAPGVLSARFGGIHGDDARNNALLLERLRQVPTGQRGARFVCALALARPDGSLALAVQGLARGTIAHAPRGTNDFGYDPLFEFDEPGFAQAGKTFAELSREAKAEVSHRGRALRALAQQLQSLRV